MKHRWIVLCLIITVLLISLMFRWETIASKELDGFKLVFEKDRWTGQAFVSQLEDNYVDTFYRKPLDAYDSEASKWLPEVENKIKHDRLAATAIWWATVIAFVALYGYLLHIEGRQ